MLHIHQRETSAFSSQQDNVSLASRLQHTQPILKSHGCGRSGCRRTNDLCERHAKIQELAHRCGQIDDRAAQVELMQVGADGVRPETEILTGRFRNSPHKRTDAVADIEQNSARTGLEHRIQRSTVVVESVIRMRMIEVGVNVAGTQRIQNSFRWNPRSDVVDHARKAGQLRCLEYPMKTGQLVLFFEVRQSRCQPHLHSDNPFRKAFDAFHR